MSRNQNHELIMQSLYAILVRIDMKEEIDIASVMEGVYKIPFNDIDLFSRGIIIKSLKHYDEISKLIEKKLKRWKWNRISKLSQAILLMSYTHFKYIEKVDKAVIIEIAVKLAKKYLDKDDYKYINAVLDNIL